MGLQEIALAGLGLVLVGGYSSKSGAGEGLSTLGAGVTSLIAAPGTGFGLGLQSTAKGIFDIGEAIGGIGRGFGELFGALPTFPDYRGPSGSSGNLVPDSGGSGSDKNPGGGGNVPPPFQGPPAPGIEDRGPGIYAVTNIAGGGFTFAGAPTIWKTEKAAMKNYAKANIPGINNV